MIVTLQLEPEAEMTVTEQAKEEGLPLNEYVKSVVKEAVFKRQRIQHLSEKSFDEILKSFRDEVETSGISDDELDDLFQQARREASQARRGK
jgi:truncated hemoglobin YjbI